MSVQDWITFPKQNADWAAWGLRGNGWMNRLSTCVNDLVDRVGVTEAEQGEVTSYTPTLTNFTTSASRMEYVQRGKLVYVEWDFTIATLTAGNIEFTLPVDPANAGIFCTGRLQLFDATTVSNHFLQPEVLLTESRIGFVADAGSAGIGAGLRLTNIYPITLAAGDILRGGLVYLSS